MVVGSVPLRDQPGRLTLVEVPLVEPDRERADRAGALLCREGRERGRVDAAGKQHADGNVGDQMCANGVAKPIKELDGERFFVLGAHRLGRDGGRSGVLLDAHVLTASALFPNEHVSREELSGLREDGHRSGHEAEREKCLESVEIDFAREVGLTEQGLQLRCERE